MNGPLIIIPTPMPAGHRVEAGQQTKYPTCDRCLRPSLPDNQIHLVQRKSQRQDELARGIVRRDALCRDCRTLLRWGYA